MTLLDGAGGDRRDRPRPAWSWWSTTRTGRTRATSSWRPRRPRPRTSRSSSAHTSGVICAPAPARAGRRAGAAPHGVGQHRGPADRLHRERRLPPRHDDGHLGRRPGRHHRRADRPGHPGRPTSTGPGTSSRCATGRGGVLKRAGHTEATVDLARAAGLAPAGVLCEIVTEDKSAMARLPELERFAKKHDLHLITIADLIRYRRQHEKLVRRVSEARIPTDARGTSRPTCTSRCSTASSTSPSCWARWPGNKTSWSGCTPSASPGTCSGHCAATAGPSCARRST